MTAVFARAFPNRFSSEKCTIIVITRLNVIKLLGSILSKPSTNQASLESLFEIHTVSSLMK